MGAGRVYSYSQTTSPHPQRDREDEWISFINKQEVKKNGLLAEKQAKGGQKGKECQGKRERQQACQGKRGRGARRLVRSASCKLPKAKTQDNKLYHRFPQEEYLLGDSSFRREGLWVGAPLLLKQNNNNKKAMHVKETLKEKAGNLCEAGGSWQIPAQRGRAGSWESPILLQRHTSTYPKARYHS